MTMRISVHVVELNILSRMRMTIKISQLIFVTTVETGASIRYRKAVYFFQRVHIRDQIHHPLYYKYHFKYQIHYPEHHPKHQEHYHKQQLHHAGKTFSSLKMWWHRKWWIWVIWRIWAYVVELNILMRTRHRVTSRTILAGTTSCKYLSKVFCK